LGDPGEAALRERLDEARALLDALRPVANAGAFLAPETVEAAALLREHDVAYFYGLHEELRPYKVLRIWLRAVAAASKGMAEVEQKVCEKTRLIALAVELLELWHDGAEAWCWPKEHGPGCCWRMPSGEVKRYLLAAYGERNKADIGDGTKAPSAPGRQAVAEALDQLEAMAHAASRRPAPALRVAGDGARLVLDLCRDDYSVVVIEAGGWRVVKPSPLALRRAPGMLPLPVQGAGPALDDLNTLLGFDGAGHDAFWALFVGFMFSCLRPALPYFVLCLGGEQGTGKSMTAKVIRTFVDPHDTSIQPKPRSEDDLFANADGQWITAYDNLSTIDQHWSDAFCRISTGTGYSKRKLYTDRDTVRFRVARPQAITAIDDVVAAPDLLDRSLLAQQPEIGPPDDEIELLARVEALAPRVLGQLLDAAAVALSGQKTIKLHTVPRMVGPTKWIEAAAEVLGLTPGQFLAAYLDSQARAGEMALESSLIGMPLCDMLDGRAALAAEAKRAGKQYAGPVGFEGTAKQLLHDLNEFMQGKPHGGPGWPRTPKGMGNALRRIAPALRKVGYVVTFHREGDAARTRNIRIDTPASDGSDCSDGDSPTQSNVERGQSATTAGRKASRRGGNGAVQQPPRDRAGAPAADSGFADDLICAAPDCGAPFQRPPGPGRPPKFCPAHRRAGATRKLGERP
jgi:hypothetical protein